MFRLHETTRRRICIAAFCCLCVAPTAAILGWCAWQQSPGRVAAEARKLSRLLGLDVSLDALTHLRPGVVSYEGFGLADPETGRKVLFCPVLKATWQQTRTTQGQDRAMLTLVATKPQIEGAAVGQVGRLLDGALQRRTAWPECNLRLIVVEATLHSGARVETLSGLEGSLEAFPDGSIAQIALRIAGANSSEPVAIRVTRDRRTMPPTTGLQVTTGGGAVPCRLLALGLKPFDALGESSRFRGTIWANHVADGWQGEVNGELSEMDLGRLMAGPSSYELTGASRVTVQSARFRRGRLEEASGTLTVGRGVASRSLIAAAADRLQCVQVVKPQGPGDLVPFEQLALAFLVNSGGLQVQGRCESAGRGAIMVDGYSCLLAEPLAQPQPLLAVWEAFAPTTPQADRLMRYLPAPRPVAQEPSEAETPHARLDTASTPSRPSAGVLDR
ncbi:MAG: hypothetical protein JXB62_15495 [Pirellulales bacterium]|nr:hypothetical protein [Pirellulales bacterium]